MTKITGIHLYGGLDANVAESYKAKEFLDSQKIDYTNLFYSDSSQFKNVLAPVNTWITESDEPVTGFPFVVWDEESNGITIRKMAIGLKAIKAANFKTEPTSKER